MQKCENWYHIKYQQIGAANNKKMFQQGNFCIKNLKFAMEKLNEKHESVWQSILTYRDNCLINGTKPKRNRNSFEFP